ncbi:hypothetical protein OAS82_02005 [Pelagibacteraceae bacterium]|jgi:hypothetical protein|nr:hypothetical protein [Pelagibacteraceae bacterium]
MKSFIYKIIIASIAVILVFKLTIGKEINQINQKINYFSTADGRKSIVNSLKKEMRKANNKENYLDEEERILINDFIKKIKKELEVNN